MTIWKVWHNFDSPDVFEADDVERGSDGSICFLLGEEVVKGYGAAKWGRVRRDHPEDIRQNEANIEAKGK